MAIILSIFLGVVPAFLYALFVYWLDRYEKEPLLLLGATFLWGAIVAAGGAFILNTVFGLGVYYFTASDAASEISTASISAPLVEESLKGLAVLIIFLIFRREFDNLLDGVVYAGIAALGFAATENSLYIYRGYADGGVGGLIFLTFIRNIVVGWQHPFYTSFIGIGLATSRSTRHILLKLAAPVAGWGLAVFTHSLHNTTSFFIQDFFTFGAVMLVEWTGWLFMLGLIVWFIYREQRYLHQYLKDEVDSGVITSRQYQTATSSIKVSMARFNALTSGRFSATRKYYQLTAELAHKKRQLDRYGEQKALLEIEKIRAQLVELGPKAAA